MSDTRIDAATTDPEVAQERAFLDHAYACLDAMRERAVHLKELGYLGGNVTEGGVTPELQEAWDAQKQARIDALADLPSALCFGRIDHAGGDRFHIGRRHVEDDRGDPVVTDWRAPVATPFYRATVADPQGLELRRRFLVEGRHLVDVFDEDLRDPDGAAAGAYVPDPLLAEVERTRTGEMRDIVATIQAEQDVIIRAPLDECIVVQGGPGTGKTAVGLHRAAFLLYEHREQLERQRLLIVGPNRIFLRYISQVLPSLGETASIQLTIEGLAGARFRPRAVDRADVAAVKGDGRMVEVLRRAVHDHIRAPDDDLRLSTAFGPVTVERRAIAEVIETARGRDRATNDSRTVIRQLLVDLAWKAHVAKPTSDVSQQAAFEADVRADKDLRDAIDRWWPTLSAAAVARRLYGNKPFRARCTDGILTPAESDLLARKAAAKVTEENWTRADLGVLDELDALVAGVDSTYGHVVVDEAQDLSALELRMVARRSRTGSMTVLGDLAQATEPAAQTSWDAAIGHLGAPKPRLEELTVGYRVPGPVMDFANRLLPEAAPGIRAATSVRLTGEPPVRIDVDPAGRAPRAVAEAVLLSERWTSVGLVVPRSLRDDVVAALGDAGADYVDGQRTLALGDHITLLPPVATKGLEFDAVVVVEPGRIAGEEANGIRLLYVVLTRAVQRLTVVCAEPLPPALEEAAAA